MITVVFIFSWFALAASNQCSQEASTCGIQRRVDEINEGLEQVDDAVLLQAQTGFQKGFRTKSKNVNRNFVGAAPVASQQACADDTYQSSSLEGQWVSNALQWTGDDHCSHMKHSDAQKWITQNEHGSFDAQLFSTTCRQGKLPQFIEPLAGILRDPRFGCFQRNDISVFSVDWLVFADSQSLNPGAQARFYDAGGSTFQEALKFFLQTYKDHGIIFDKVYVWEYHKQGTESYWSGTPSAIRRFWESKVEFYDGVGVVADKNSKDNPVSRIFNDCAAQDFCAFKLDIDTPAIEWPLVQQLVDMQSETKAKLDEFFFEHHVSGVMQKYWGAGVNGTFADSYQLFSTLRHMGVRAHSWV